MIHTLLFVNRSAVPSYPKPLPPGLPVPHTLHTWTESQNNSPPALSCLCQVFYYSNSKVSLSLDGLGHLGVILRARILILGQREQLSIWTEFLSADFSSLCSLLSFQAWAWHPANALFSRHCFISFILSYNEGQEWLRIKKWQPWNYLVFRRESLSLPFLSDVLTEFYLFSKDILIFHPLSVFVFFMVFGYPDWRSESAVHFLLSGWLCEFHTELGEEHLVLV